MKIKLKGAQKGHCLLKRKSDALTARFRLIVQRIRDAKLTMGKAMKHAAFVLAEVHFAAGDISYAVREKATHAQLKVRARMENVSGVQLPVFECVADGGTSGLSATAGAAHEANTNIATSTNETSQWLGRGGQQVLKCRDAFIKALHALVELAALQTAFFVLDDVIRATNRRVAALEYVVLPKVEGTLAYIISELDEQDREDFFRLKKVQNNKKKETERIELSLKTLRITQRDTHHAEPSCNLLADSEDADVFV